MNTTNSTDPWSALPVDEEVAKSLSVPATKTSAPPQIKKRRRDRRLAEIGDLGDEIVDLAIAGCSYDEIEKELEISQRTIKWFLLHDEQALAKMAAKRAFIQEFAVDTLRMAGVDAVQTLQGLARYAVDEETRRKAANDILSHLGKLTGQAKANEKQQAGLAQVNIVMPGANADMPPASQAELLDAIEANIGVIEG